MNATAVTIVTLSSIPVLVLLPQVLRHNGTNIVIIILKLLMNATAVTIVTLSCVGSTATSTTA